MTHGSPLVSFPSLRELRTSLLARRLADRAD